MLAPTPSLSHNDRIQCIQDILDKRNVPYISDKHIFKLNSRTIMY